MDETILNRFQKIEIENSKISDFLSNSLVRCENYVVENHFVSNKHRFLAEVRQATEESL
jgi:hypothetical protein